MNVNMILDMMSLPIFGHINPSHNNHFGVASHIMVLNVGDFAAHENQEKCGSVVRVELEKFHWFNSNGQNTIYLEYFLFQSKKISNSVMHQLKHTTKILQTQDNTGALCDSRMGTSFFAFFLSGGGGKVNLKIFIIF